MRAWEFAMRAPLAVCLALGCAPEPGVDVAEAPPPAVLPLFVDWHYPPEANPRVSGLARYLAVDAYVWDEERLATIAEEVAKDSARGSLFQFIDGVPAIVPAVPGVSCLDVPVQGELTDCTLWEATEHVLRSIACDERFRDNMALHFSSGRGPAMPESYWQEQTHQFSFAGLTAREALLEIVRVSGYEVNFAAWHFVPEGRTHRFASINISFYKDGKWQSTSPEETPDSDDPIWDIMNKKRAVTPLENCPGAEETPAP